MKVLIIATTLALSSSVFFNHKIFAQDKYRAAVENLIYQDNTSLDAIPGMSYIHMHNKAGLRVEYNLNRQRLVLWTSPLAGKSIETADRNFSNRDDHTSIFDFIGFPELPYSDFLRCEYDPFYSKLFFKENTLHILTIVDQSAVLIWFEKPSYVDIKTDKIDGVKTTTPTQFGSVHVERAKTFEFVAKLSTGTGQFTHQKVKEVTRSFYTRAQLVPGQFMVIAGEVVAQNPVQTALLLAERDLNTIISSNEQKINQQTKFGRIIVRNKPDLQKIINLNKRILCAMQDESGAMRAALRHIYYLIWHRDGGMVFSYNAYTGWLDPLKKWCEFILANPTKNEKGERFWGQLVSPITKLEEDGPFYGIWSVFTYTAQSADSTLLTASNLQVMDDNIAWLENNYFDKSKGLFYRYHYCESPYYNTPGYGWDDAVGSQSLNPRPYTWKGDTITKAFDTYLNNIVYASYVMMAMLHTDPKKQDEYLSKAKQLVENLKPYFSASSDLPNYGELVTVKGNRITAEAPGPDETDYQWGFGLPLFYPHYQNLEQYREILAKQHMAKPSGQFLSGLFSNIMCLDTEIHPSEKIQKTIEYVIPQTIKSGRCLPMPYTVPEIVDVEDCNIYHDVRPQPFSISAYFATIANLGLRKLPFGIAVRGTDYLDSISYFQYKKKVIHFSYKGKGTVVSELRINDKRITNTLQIPEKYLDRRENKILVVSTETEKSKKPLWIGSTLTMIDVVSQKVYAKAHGHNLCMFKYTDKKNIQVLLDAKPVSFESFYVKDILYIQFEGKGTVEIAF